MPDLVIQKAGSASDVITKNNNRAIYGNILGQEIAAEAGIITRVTRQAGGGGAASSRNVSAIGGTIFTYAERAAVVSNIIANTATNATNALVLAAAASDIGVTVTSPFLPTNANTPQVILWTPINSAGLNVWLDGADPAGTGTPPSSGATVSTWADKSGNSYSTTSVVGTPTYNPTDGIVMNGSSYFTLPNSSIPFNNSSYSIYSVVKASLFNTRGWFGAGGTTGSTGLSLRFEGSLRILTYWNTNDFLAESPRSVNVTFLFVSQYQTAGQRTAFINGSAAGSDTPSPSARSQPNTGNLIGKTVDTNPMTGTIGEVLVYNVNHTLAQRQQIEGYLAWKWGLQTLLPITHLYYSAAPRL